MSQNTASAAVATDPVPSRNPQGIPFRVPTRAELIKYIGDYAEAYRSEEHDRHLSKAVKAEVRVRASQRLNTAIDYLYGRNADLERALSSHSAEADRND